MYRGCSESYEPGVGVGAVTRRVKEEACVVLGVEGATMRLGLWWLDVAVRGAVEQLPLVNAKPLFEEARRGSNGRGARGEQ